MKAACTGALLLLLSVSPGAAQAPSIPEIKPQSDVKVWTPDKRHDGRWQGFRDSLAVVGLTVGRIRVPQSAIDSIYVYQREAGNGPSLAVWVLGGLVTGYLIGSAGTWWILTAPAGGFTGLIVGVSLRGGGSWEPVYRRRTDVIGAQYERSINRSR